MPAYTSRIYPGIGRCIYCGDRESPLTDEHVIPRSLNGRLILKNASCGACAEITKANEEIVARQMLWPMRTAFGFRTRRPKERPTSFRAPIVRRGNHDHQEFSVPDYPVTAVLGMFGPPGILSGDEPIGEFRDVVFWQMVLDKAHEFLRDNPGTALQIGPFNAGVYARLLAKIGHGLVTTYFRDGSFKPLLPPIIIGKSEALSYLIGGDKEFRAPSEHAYEIGFEIKEASGRRFLVARIWFLANLAGPMYRIVASEIPPTGALPESRFSDPVSP